MWHKEPDAPTELLDLIPKRPTSTGVIQWTERVSKSNGTVWIQEGTALTSQSTFKWKTLKADVSKISEFIKVSKEALSDSPQVRSEIEYLISTGIRQKLNRAILDETLVNDANAFNGIDFYSQAFAPGYTMEAGVDANEFDVILAAQNQTKQNQFNANVCLVSVKKLGQMMGLRDGDGTYLKFPYATVQAGDSMVVNGIRIIAATWIDDDDFYIFDSKYTALFVKNNIELEMYDQNEDDALADLVTIKATGRFYLRIVANYVKAFVKGTFTAAKATITAS
jgi:HK97 family phage major capsid protein